MKKWLRRYIWTEDLVLTVFVFVVMLTYHWLAK
jgi:hypothetical protein